MHHPLRRRRRDKALEYSSQSSPLFLLVTALLILGGVRTATAWALNRIFMSGPRAYQWLTDSVAHGAEKGLDECRHQFKWDRWNCSQNTIPILSSYLHKGDREASFIHAIISAGITFLLTRNCSVGTEHACRCDTAKNGPKSGSGWQWGGCSDNIEFASEICRQFMDNLESASDSRAAMNKHNNEAGRKAVRRKMKTVCKCHGVSGTCSVKTCWEQLPEFRQIGKLLKRKYTKSIRVDYQRGKLQFGNTANSANVRLQSISKSDLVYLVSSPDYCVTNTRLSTLGTIGRECRKPGKNKKAMKWKKRSCNRLCKSCGYQVKRELVNVTYSCSCKFHWCCTVQCEKCDRKQYKYFCASQENHTQIETNP